TNGPRAWSGVLEPRIARLVRVGGARDRSRSRGSASRAREPPDARQRADEEQHYEDRGTRGSASTSWISPSHRRVFSALVRNRPRSRCRAGTWRKRRRTTPRYDTENTPL